MDLGLLNKVKTELEQRKREVNGITFMIKKLQHNKILRRLRWKRARNIRWFYNTEVTNFKEWPRDTGFRSKDFHYDYWVKLNRDQTKQLVNTERD